MSLCTAAEFKYRPNRLLYASKAQRSGFLRDVSCHSKYMSLIFQTHKGRKGCDLDMFPG